MNAETTTDARQLALLENFVSKQRRSKSERVQRMTLEEYLSHLKVTVELASLNREEMSDEAAILAEALLVILERPFIPANSKRGSAYAYEKWVNGVKDVAGRGLKDAYGDSWLDKVRFRKSQFRDK